MKRTSVLVAFGVLGAAAPALAHHSIAAVYDRGKTVEVEGVLSKVDLVNPHALLEVTVPAKSGPAAVWALEGRGVQGMTRVGFNHGAVAIGDKVTVKGSPARDGSRALWLNTLTAGKKTYDFSFGRRF
jgi:hypothetical protein